MVFLFQCFDQCSQYVGLLADGLHRDYSSARGLTAMAIGVEV